MYSIQQSQKSDCHVVAHYLREADIRELFAASGLQPLTVLLRCYSDDPEGCYTVFYDNKPVGMFGVVRHMEDIGIPWLLGTDDLVQNRREFYKLSQEFLHKFQKQYKFLSNFIDKRNEVAINWLSHLGAQFVREIPDYGFEKRPFLEFLFVR